MKKEINKINIKNREKILKEFWETKIERDKLYNEEKLKYEKEVSKLIEFCFGKKLSSFYKKQKGL